MKFILTADNHLRAEQYGSARRGQDFTKGFLEVIRVATEQGVRHIVCAGDLLDQVRPSQRTIRDLAMLQATLMEARLTCHVLIGNHDDTPEHWSQCFNPIVQSEYGFHSLDGKLVTITDDTGSTTLFGIPSVPVPAFKSCVKQKAHYLVLHMPIVEFSGFPTKGMLTMADIDEVCAAVGYKSVLVGDLHLTSTRRTPGGIPVSYPGSTEMTDASHEAQKYVMLVDTENDIPTALPIRTRPVAKYRIDDDDKLAAVISQIRSEADKEGLVYVHYNPEIPGILSRLRSSVPLDKIVLRTHPLSIRERRGDVPQGPVSIANVDKIDIGDLIVASVPSDHPVFGVLRNLCNPESNSSQCLKEFIAERALSKGIPL